MANQRMPRFLLTAGYVAYVIDDLGKRSLHVRQIQVAKSGDVEIVPPSEAFYSGLTFSNDA